jgi:large subunit ribosomal protein L22
MEQSKGSIQGVAKIKGCGMSARKMRLVVDIVRGLPVEKALGVLKYTRKEAALWVSKLLTSAIANWKVNANKISEGAEPEEYNLKVSAIWSDQAPALKRFRPAPHGRANRIRKHYCHATLIVENTLALATDIHPTVEEEVTEDVTAIVE